MLDALPDVPTNSVKALKGQLAGLLQNLTRKVSI